MKKDINIVTSLVGAGLEREALLLKALLMEHDCYVNMMHYTNFGSPMVRADINIFLEVVFPPVLSLSRENWLAPNCEWWDEKNDRFLPQFTKIICKTTDCYDIWSKKVGPAKCVLTSFEARDLYKPEIPREVKCLHVAGKSEYKNTDAVLKAWRMSHMPHVMNLPHLTAVVRNPLFDEHFKKDSPFPDGNVTYIPHATDEQIIELMNSHQIHVIPSLYEGFGHVIHEALGCGALVLTTDAPPMNGYAGIAKDYLIPVDHKVPRKLAQLNYVSPHAVNNAVRQAWNMIGTKPERAAEISTQAREGFLANREFFRKTIMDLVNSVR